MPNALFLPLPAPRPAELDVHGEVRVPLLVAQQARRAAGVDRGDVLVAVVVDVGDDERSGASRAEVRRENRRAVEEPASAVVAQEHEAVRARARADDEIEPAVVVVSTNAADAIGAPRSAPSAAAERVSRVKVPLPRLRQSAASPPPATTRVDRAVVVVVGRGDAPSRSSRSRPLARRRVG